MSQLPNCHIKVVFKDLICVRLNLILNLLTVRIISHLSNHESIQLGYIFMELNACRSISDTLFDLFNQVTQSAICFKQQLQSMEISLQLQQTQNSIPQVQTQHYYKGYLLFFTGLRQAIIFNRNNTLYHLILAFLFVIFIPIDAVKFGDSSNIIYAAFALALLTSFTGVFTYVVPIFCIFDNFPKIYQIAKRLGCLSKTERMQKTPLSISQWQKSVFFCNHNGVDLVTEQFDDQRKEIFIKQMKLSIQSQARDGSPCYVGMEALVSFLALTAIIVSIVAISIGQPNNAEIAVFVIFIILEAIFILPIIIIIALIALSPLLCIIACILACCCAPANQVIQIPSKKATIEDIVRTGQDCPICFQNFVVDEDIVLLPCNPKHMFHDSCFKKWIIVKQTCPICRHDLTKSPQPNAN